MQKIKEIIEGKLFQNFITGVIIFNAVLLGMMTSKGLVSSIGGLMDWLSVACIVIFTIEIILRLMVYRLPFFKEGWNIFDFILVAISLIPATATMSSFRVLRVLRVLRTLRLLSSLKNLRIIVKAILVSLPSVSWASVLLLIFFYIFAILGQNLFGENFPDWFGTLGSSMYTLFQIMTLESWSMGISRPVMEIYPWAWIYFVPFVLISSYVVLNVVVGVVVNAVSNISSEEENDKTSEISNEDLILENEKDLAEIKRLLENIEKRMKSK